MERAKTFRPVKARNYHDGISRAKKIRSSHRWTKVSLLKRGKNPLCEDPFGDHARTNATVQAEEVHHKIPVEERPDLAFHEDNLLSVCRPCHERMEGNGRSKVVVVFGAPCSGKNRYVRLNKAIGDMVIDVDALAVALGADERSHDAFVPFLVAARDAVIQRLRFANAIPRAWIITTTRTVMELCKRELQAEVVQMPGTLDDCLRYASDDLSRVHVISEQQSIIREWFERDKAMPPY